MNRIKCNHHLKVKPCLFPGCASKSLLTSNTRIRGLCPSHYYAAYLLVHAKLTSWKKLEEAGRSLPPKPRTHPLNSIKNWFLNGVLPNNIPTTPKNATKLITHNSKTKPALRIPID